MMHQFKSENWKRSIFLWRSYICRLGFIFGEGIMSLLCTPNGPKRGHPFLKGLASKLFSYTWWVDSYCILIYSIMLGIKGGCRKKQNLGIRKLDNQFANPDAWRHGMPSGNEFVMVANFPLAYRKQTRRQLPNEWRAQICLYPSSAGTGHLSYRNNVNAERCVALILDYEVHSLRWSKMEGKELIWPKILSPRYPAWPRPTLGSIATKSSKEFEISQSLLGW